VYEKCTDGSCHIKSDNPIIVIGRNNIYEVKYDSNYFYYKQGNDEEWIIEDVSIL
jgi:hypothetical protein